MHHSPKGNGHLFLPYMSKKQCGHWPILLKHSSWGTTFKILPSGYVIQWLVVDISWPRTAGPLWSHAAFPSRSSSACRYLSSSSECNIRSLGKTLEPCRQLWFLCVKQISPRMLETPHTYAWQHGNSIRWIAFCCINNFASVRRNWLSVRTL